MATISQTLRSVKSLKGKMAELSARVQKSALYDVAEKPAWDFATCRKELDTLREKLIRAETAIAVANATKSITVDGKTVTLAHAIRHLQELKGQLAFTQQIQTQVLHERKIKRQEPGYGPDGLRTMITVEQTFIAALTESEQADELQKLKDQFQTWNDALETANHTTVVEL